MTEKAQSRSPVAILRERAGVSQRELSAAMNVNRNLIVRLETGDFDVEDGFNNNPEVESFFDKLADLSGEEKDTLMREQVEFIERVTERGAKEVFSRLSGAFYGYMVLLFKSFEEEWEDEDGDRHRDRKTPLVESGVNWLKRLREQAGITQRQLARAAEVSHSMIARIESGDYDFEVNENFGEDKPEAKRLEAQRLLNFLNEAFKDWILPNAYDPNNDPDVLWDAIGQITDDLSEKCGCEFKEYPICFEQIQLVVDPSADDVVFFPSPYWTELHKRFQARIEREATKNVEAKFNKLKQQAERRKKTEDGKEG